LWWSILDQKLKIYSVIGSFNSWVEVNPNATTTAKGLVQLADAAAITAGTAGRVVDAAQLNDAIKHNGLLTSGTYAHATGVSVDFTGIPSSVKRITVMLDAVKRSGSSLLQFQIGDSGGIETTGYRGSTGNQAAGSAGTAVYPGAGFYVSDVAPPTAIYHGSITLSLIGGNAWVGTGIFGRSDTGLRSSYTVGSKNLSDTLDRIRITTVNGTDSFNDGFINIMYEG
jgi:hypothetical protein